MEFEVPGSFTTRVIDANMTACHLCQIADIVRISPFPVLLVPHDARPSYGTAGTGILSYGWSCYQDQPMRTVPALYQSDGTG